MKYSTAAIFIVSTAVLTGITFYGGYASSIREAASDRGIVMMDKVVDNSSTAPVYLVRRGGGGGFQGHGGGGHMHGGRYFHRIGVGVGFSDSFYGDAPDYEGTPVDEPSCVWNGYKWSCYDPAGNLM